MTCSVVLLKPNVGQVFCFDFMKGSFGEHFAAAVTIDGNASFIFSFKEKWTDNSPREKTKYFQLSARDECVHELA